MIRQTSLKHAATTSKRRHSTPARTSAGNGLSGTPSSLPVSGEIHFLPLRQVLDGRVQRRIRRNGLSEEMNSIHEDKRRQAREIKAEIERLKAEVQAKDEEICRLQNETIIMDTEKIWDLEKQVEDLKRVLAERSGVYQHNRSYDWTLAARDPYSADYMDTTEDEVFGENTAAEFACSTPTRAARNSFPSPPATSPTMPLTPSSHFATPKSHVGVQVSFPDPEKAQLEDEMASLQLELCKLTTTLESYMSLASRLSERMGDFEDSGLSVEQSDPASSHQAIEAQVECLLRTLADRKAALLDLTASLSDLGFPGNDASEIVSSLASGFRAARLELEYLTPGEITTPLSSHGAEVLDLLLTRLRDVAKQVREDDAAIDEYHELELSLRQQLGARVSAMDGLSAELARAEQLLGEKTTRVQDLEVSVDRLKGAVNGYIHDVAELESWVERMEKDGRDAAEAHKAQIQENKESLLGKESCIAELEARLAAAVTQTEALKKEVDDVRATKTKDQAALNKQHGTALAIRDARVSELRGEIDRVNDSLRAAHETIRKLRVENSGLEAKVESEKQKAKAVIDSMKEELQRMVRMSQDFLNTPKKQQPARRGSDAGRDSGFGTASEGVPSSPLVRGVVVNPGGLLSGDLAKKGLGKKRRRYDSGLGFLDEDELPVDA
jgi:chromosome segregation ATPase